MRFRPEAQHVVPVDSDRDEECPLIERFGGKGTAVVGRELDKVKRGVPDGARVGLAMS
jgi:hypothetical protein